MTPGQFTVLLGEIRRKKQREQANLARLATMCVNYGMSGDMNKLESLVRSLLAMPPTQELGPSATAAKAALLGSMGFGKED